MKHRTQPSRRDLLASSTAAAVVGATPVLGRRGESREVLKVGLVGCGGRGTGAAAQALRADPNTKLVALADAVAALLVDVRTDRERAFLPLIADQLKEELNIKAVRDAREQGGLLSLSVKPNLP